MALHVKTGDVVKIIAGVHKGDTGKVLHVYPKKRKIIVQGRNVVKKHVRPSTKNPQGGRIDVEQPIDISNVLPINPKSSRETRVSYKIEKDGSKKRVAADGTEIGTVRRAK